MARLDYQKIAQDAFGNDLQATNYVCEDWRSRGLTYTCTSRSGYVRVVLLRPGGGREVLLLQKTYSGIWVTHAVIVQLDFGNVHAPILVQRHRPNRGLDVLPRIDLTEGSALVYPVRNNPMFRNI